jgi:hypothetical protein
MTELDVLFQPVCEEVRKELKKVLSGIFTGQIVKGYLPQNWVFATEDETVTFSVDKKGNATILQGPCSEPDVTIRIDGKYLAAALKDRKKPDFEYQNFEVKFHTGKGETAFGYLRKRLGL